MADAYFQKGCSLFVDEDYEAAFQAFSQALDQDSTSEVAQEYFIKRSACAHKLNKFTDALSDANSAIAINPNNSKAYLRKGLACFSLDEFETAKAAFVKGKEIDSKDSSFQLWIRKCDAEISSENDDGEEEVAETVTTTTTTTTTPSPSPSSDTTLPPPIEKPKQEAVRHSWYQSNTHVFITFFVRNRKDSDVKVEFGKQSLDVNINLDDGRTWVFDISLCDEIIPEESRTEISPANIEVKLKKQKTFQWGSLENTGAAVLPTPSSSSSSTSAPDNVKMVYPSSSKKKKDWDKVVSTVEEDKLEGEQALNKVFQDIFSKGSDEQRRAMMKSFVESGGTVLSTNWDEVGKEEVKGSAPKGMEMKQWGKD